MDHKPCEICKTKTKVECMQCRKFYCNNLTSSNMSHILLHLTKCSHDEVKVVKPLMCQKCRSNNVFDLGVISDRLPLFEVTVRKTVECEKNEDIETVMPNVFDRLVCRFCCNGDGYASIIYDGSIIKSFVSSYTLKNADTDICDKEKKVVDLPKVKLVYSQKEYVEVYTVLLNYEHELESKNAKHCSVKDVNVRFESRTENIRQFLSETDMIETTSYYLYADIGTATKYGHCGGIVNLVSKTSSIYGVMMNHVKSNELKVKVFKINGNINIDAKYILTYNPFPCPKARRFMGLTRLNKIDYTLAQYIRGIGIEREYRKIEIAHTDKNIITDIPGLPKLNYAQLLSIRYALQKKLVLIQGPPGTGKTVTAAAIAYNMLKMNTRRKILVVANNNTAVNNITEKLYLTGLNVVRVVSHIRGSFDDDLSFISSNHLARMSYYENLRKNNKEIIEENHKNIPEKILIEYEKSVIRSADVVTTTMISSGKQIFEGCYFPVVIVDEATQCVEPINLIPLVHGCKKLILIGDHKQLGPFVPDENLERAGFDQTLFQRFIKLKYTPILLDVQYSMHPSLSYLPSRLFYSNKLKNGVDSRERRSRMDLPFPTFFYGCFGREEIFSNGLSCVNQLEADQCISVVKFLIDSNVNEKDIGIITAYEGQRNLLLRKLSAFNLDFLEIKNVDGYQGREKEDIIFCTVRSNSNQGIGFLSDTRRINVGLTRAKRGLVIIGNPYTLSTNSVWYSVVKFYNDNDLMFAGDINNLGHIQLRI